MKSTHLNIIIDKLMTRFLSGDESVTPELNRYFISYPNNVYVKNAKGCVALTKANADEAIECLRYAFLNGHPKKTPIIKNLLVAYSMAGKEKEFEKLWDEILKNTKFSEIDIKVMISNCFDAAVITNQMTMLKKINSIQNERYNDDWEIKISSIEIDYRMGQKKSAHEKFKELIKLSSEDFLTNIKISELAFKIKHPEGGFVLSMAASSRTNDLYLLRRFLLCCVNFKSYKLAREIENQIELTTNQPNADLYMSLNIAQQVNDWDKVEKLVPEYLQAVKNGSVIPDGLFRHLSLPGLTDEDHHKLANAYVKNLKFDPKLIHKENNIELKEEKFKISIGVMSSDFSEHAVAQLSVQVFEKIDRKKFKLIGYDLSEAQPSLLRSRMIDAFDEISHQKYTTDQKLIEKVRNDKIDILIDLNGDTTGTRCWLFRYRLAPIQVGWLGFPGGLGEKTNDYIIADKHVIPEKSFSFFSEKPVWMPYTYLPNDPDRQPIAAPSRASVELPENSIVFCSFNGQYKITREIFEAWCKILLKVENSVLWLRNENEDVQEAYKDYSQRLGVNPNRIIFAARTKLQIDHLARLQCADIALDTRPYGSHTTCVDALWAGVPLITAPCDTFASRVASGILHAVGLDALVGKSLDDYIDIAVDLASNTEKLQYIKKTLVESRLTSPLYNVDTFTRYLEAAFLAMYDRFRMGLSPAPILSLDKYLSVDDTRKIKKKQISPLLRIEEAEAYLYKDMHAQSWSLYLQLLNELPDNPRVNHGAALVLSLQGNYDDAIKYIDNAISYDSQNDLYIEHKKIIIEKKEKDVSNKIKNLFDEALFEHKKNNIDKAILLYEEILKISPCLPSALHYSGVAHCQKNEYRVGLDLILKSIKIQPNNINFSQNYNLFKEKMMNNESPKELNLNLGGELPNGIWLHVGGQEPKPGWTMLNIIEKPGVDIVADIRNLSMLDEQSCARIYAAHVLEHVHQNQVLSVLTGFKRLLKQGGELLISVPDMDILCSHYMDPKLSANERYHVMRMIFGGQVDSNDFHYVGFNFELIHFFLKRAGFLDIKRVERFDIFNDTSSFAPYGKLISLNVIAKY